MAVVSRWRAAYTNGDWAVLAGPTSLVVLDPAADPGLVAELWPQVVGAASIGDLAERLAQTRVHDLPSLGAFFWSPEGMRSLVRGAISVCDADTGSRLTSGDDVVTWTETSLADAVRIEVALGASPAASPLEAPIDRLPLVVGVVRAGSLALDAGESGLVASPQLADPSAETSVDGDAPVEAFNVPAEGSEQGEGTDIDAVPPAEPVVVEPEPAEPEPELPDLPDLPEPTVPEPTVPVPDEPVPDEPVPDEPVPDEAVEVAAAMPAAPPPRSPPLPPPPPPPPPADLPVRGREVEWGGWGAPARPAARATPSTQSAAAVPPPAAAAEISAAAMPAASPSTFVDSPVAQPPAGAAFGQPTPVQAGPAPTRLDLSPLDEMETGDTQLMQPSAANLMEEGGTVLQAAPTASGIAACRCPSGHLNPPGATQCRVCRQPVPPQQPIAVSQPILARLRSVDGSVVDLDRAVLIGRAPSEDKSMAALPRLMTVPSPSGDISRTHVEVIPDGWRIMITDLRSTNGTVALRSDQGGARQQLPPGVPTEVPLGSVLELGDGMSILIDLPG